MPDHPAPTRRLLLLAATMLLGAPQSRAAESKRQTAHGHKAADPAPAGSPADTPVGPVDTAAKQALIVDFNSGATLLAKDADVPMTPSSMTKLMTAYIVYGILKAGRLKLDQT